MSSKFVKDIDKLSFGKQVRVCRTMTGMTQTEFGHLCAVSQRTLSNIENEVGARISTDTKEQVRKILVDNGFLTKQNQPKEQ